MTEIEHGSLFLDLLVANTPRDFIRRLEQDPRAQAVRQQVATDEPTRHLLLARAEHLLEQSSPTGYLHVNDVPVGAYLYLLAATPDPGVSKLASRLLDSKEHHFLMARHAAQFIAEPQSPEPQPT